MEEFYRIFFADAALKAANILFAKPQNHHDLMKFILTALFVSSFAASATFAADCDCPSKAKSEKKKESTLVAECDGKCKKGDKKEEGTLAECDGKCKKGDKKEEGTLA
jgi:hypothetical protein